MRTIRMRAIYKPLVLVMLFLVAGCTIKHDYVWYEYPIGPERLNWYVSFDDSDEIRIIRGQSDDSQIFLGNVGAHQYFGSLQSLTDGIADQLAMELRKRQLDINSTAQKSLEVTVISQKFERGMWRIAATLDFLVKFANGTIKSYTVRNSSPGTVDQTYNGAVALAVIEIINDQEVQAYINE